MIGEVVKHYSDQTLEYYSGDGVPTGEHVTIRAVLRPLLARYAELPVTEFGPKKLKQVRDDMIKLDWSRRTINKAVSIVKR